MKKLSLFKKNRIEIIQNALSKDSINEIVWSRNFRLGDLIEGNEEHEKKVIGIFHRFVAKAIPNKFASGYEILDCDILDQLKEEREGDINSFAGPATVVFRGNLFTIWVDDTNIQIFAKIKFLRYRR